MLEVMVEIQSTSANHLQQGILILRVNMIPVRMGKKTQASKWGEA